MVSQIRVSEKLEMRQGFFGYQQLESKGLEAPRRPEHVFLTISEKSILANTSISTKTEL